jgi:hypothetical protein
LTPLAVADAAFGDTLAALSAAAGFDAIQDHALSRCPYDRAH